MTAVDANVVDPRLHWEGAIIDILTGHVAADSEIQDEEEPVNCLKNVSQAMRLRIMELLELSEVRNAHDEVLLFVHQNAYVAGVPLDGIHVPVVDVAHSSVEAILSVSGVCKRTGVQVKRAIDCVGRIDLLNH